MPDERDDETVLLATKVAPVLDKIRTRVQLMEQCLRVFHYRKHHFTGHEQGWHRVRTDVIACCARIDQTEDRLRVAAANMDGAPRTVNLRAAENLLMLTRHCRELLDALDRS